MNEITPVRLVSLFAAFKVFAIKFPIPSPNRHYPIQSENEATFRVSIMIRAPPKLVRILKPNNLWASTNFASTMDIHKDMSSETKNTVTKFVASLSVQSKIFTAKVIPKLVKLSSLVTPRHVIKHNRNNASNKLHCVHLQIFWLCTDGDVASLSMACGQWLSLQPEWNQLRNCIMLPTTDKTPAMKNTFSTSLWNCFCESVVFLSSK